MPWGTAGPRALTYLADRHGIASLASPPDTFHPIHWRSAQAICDPALPLEAIVSEETLGIHLWAEITRKFHSAPAPEGSLLHRIQREGR
jgi:hypothetical protein